MAHVLFSGGGGGVCRAWWRRGWGQPAGTDWTRIAARIVSSEAAETSAAVVPVSADAASVTAALRGAVARLALRQRHQNTPRAGNDDDAMCTTNGSLPAALERFIAEDMLQGVKGRRVRRAVAASSLQTSASAAMRGVRPRSTNSNKDAADAYVASAFAGEYAVMNRIVSELHARFPEFEPRKLLEVCHENTAVGTLASLPVFLSGDSDDAAMEDSSGRRRRVDITAVCESAAMRDAATRLIHAATSALGTDDGDIEPTGSMDMRSTRSRVDAMMRGTNVTWLRKLPSPAARRDRFDLVISAFALSKLHADNANTKTDGDEHHLVARTTKIDTTTAAAAGSNARPRTGRTRTNHRRQLMDMWELVDEGGMLVLVEDGSNEGCTTIQDARRLLLSADGRHSRRALQATCSDDDVGGALERQRRAFHIAGPCPHEMECPRAIATSRKTSRCFFRQRIEPPRYRRYAEDKRKRKRKRDT